LPGCCRCVDADRQLSRYRSAQVSVHHVLFPRECSVWTRTVAQPDRSGRCRRRQSLIYMKREWRRRQLHLTLIEARHQSPTSTPFFQRQHRVCRPRCQAAAGSAAQGVTCRMIVSPRSRVIARYAPKQTHSLSHLNTSPSTCFDCQEHPRRRDRHRLGGQRYAMRAWVRTTG